MTGVIPRRAIFLHGVGGTGAGLRAMAGKIAGLPETAFPDGPHPFEKGAGRQWFSIIGVTDANRPGRIAEAMPGFIRMVEAMGNPRESLLVGFSQGAIMSLHATAEGLRVARVVAISGRLAAPVRPRDDWPAITMLHGTADAVIPPEKARNTEAWLTAAGASPRLTLFEGLGHTIDRRVREAIREAILAGGT